MPASICLKSYKVAFNPLFWKYMSYCFKKNVYESSGYVDIKIKLKSIKRKTINRTKKNKKNIMFNKYASHLS